MTKKKPELVGPTWWCPVDGATEDHPLAERHVDKGRKLYVPVAQAQYWCIEGGPTRYGYARPLDGGYYAFARAARCPKLGVQAWLVKLHMGLEPEVIAGPFKERVPERRILQDLRASRRHDDDLYFTATLKDGQLAVQAFSGGHMGALHAKAEAPTDARNEDG